MAVEAVERAEPTGLDQVVDAVLTAEQRRLCRRQGEQGAQAAPPPPPPGHGSHRHSARVVERRRRGKRVVERPAAAALFALAMRFGRAQVETRGCRVPVAIIFSGDEELARTSRQAWRYLSDLELRQSL